MIRICPCWLAFWVWMIERLATVPTRDWVSISGSGCLPRSAFRNGSALALGLRLIVNQFDVMRRGSPSQTPKTTRKTLRGFSTRPLQQTFSNSCTATITAG